MLVSANGGWSSLLYPPIFSFTPHPAGWVEGFIPRLHYTIVATLKTSKNPLFLWVGVLINTFSCMIIWLTIMGEFNLHPEALETHQAVDHEGRPDPGNPTRRPASLRMILLSLGYMLCLREQKQEELN